MLWIIWPMVKSTEGPCFHRIAMVDADICAMHLAESWNSMFPLSASIRFFMTAEEFLASADLTQLSGVIIALELSDMSGLQLWYHLKKYNGLLPVIFTEKQSTILSAVTVMKLGAIDYIEKPLSILKLSHMTELVVKHSKSLRHASK